MFQTILHVRARADSAGAAEIPNADVQNLIAGRVEVRDRECSTQALKRNHVFLRPESTFESLGDL
jgi:hypothetical protein